MATWARPSQQAVSPAPRWSASDASAELRLPPLPFEDVYLHRKPIDNRRLHRTPAQGSRRVYARAFLDALLLFSVLLLILLPRHMSRVVAHELLAEESRMRSLEAARADLDAREAELLSPARLEEWARSLQLVDPAPGQMLALAPKPDRALAARRRVQAASGNTTTAR